MLFLCLGCHFPRATLGRVQESFLEQCYHLGSVGGKPAVC